MKVTRWISATLAAVLVVGGPMSTATAQTVPPPPPPVPVTVPFPTPVPVMPSIHEPGRGAEIGAGFLNVVHVPGKAIVCGAGTVAAAVFMLATFGFAYGAAVDIFNEGCGGRWLLTPYDVSSIRPPEDR